MNRSAAEWELTICTVKYAVLLDHYGRLDFEAVRLDALVVARRLKSALASGVPSDLEREVEDLVRSFESLAVQCNWARSARVPIAANSPPRAVELTRH